MKLLEKKNRKKSLTFLCAKNFGCNPKSTAVREKINKWDCIVLKHSWTANEILLEWIDNLGGNTCKPYIIRS